MDDFERRRRALEEIARRSRVMDGDHSDDDVDVDVDEDLEPDPPAA